MIKIKELLTNRLSISQKQGERYLDNVRSTYEDLSDEDFALAERRLLGIVTYYRNKEKSLQQKVASEQEAKRPTSDDQWQSALSKRKTPTTAQESRSRKRNRSRTASRSRSRSRGNQAPSTSGTQSRAPRPSASRSRQGPPRRGGRFGKRSYQPAPQLDEDTVWQWFLQRRGESRRRK